MEQLKRKRGSRFTPEQRFWQKVDKRGEDECWPWTAATRNGYGVLNIGGRVVYAHRYCLEIVSGPLKKGERSCHSCDNSICCNPKHLFRGTQSDNMKDMYAKGRGARKSGGGKKLRREQVCRIRELDKQGVRYPAIAEQFGISVPHVCLIVNGKRWKGVVIQ